MHELSIVTYVVKQVQEIAKENNLTEIESVTLEFGEVSGIVPEYLEDCWNWYTRRDGAGQVHFFPAHLRSVDFRRGADGGDHPGRHLVRRLQANLSDRTIRQDLPALRQRQDLAAAGQ